MCGIAGIVQGNGTEQAAMARMLHALRHRGPDGEWQYGADGAIFGHRRLSIIDLEGGRQPLLNADRSVWVVCNGEIYNYRELRKDFEQRGYPFQTHSDCELIIALYERHGERLIEHLRGMFAFGLWDVRRRKLIVARDHLGQKPLYYARTAAGFAFASEIKALLACDPALRQMDLEALDQYLALRLIAPPRSMYRGIRKLPPGHMLVVEDGGEPTIRRYWDLGYQPKLEGSDEALTDQLEQQVDEALRLHLVSDVPVGAFLSGGLDSSLLVAMLAQRVGVKNLPTFTVGLPYAQFDEAPHARAVARAAGTEHHERTLDASLLKYLPQLIYHLDEPSDPLSLCAYQVAELASQHVKVVIGGDGGDELFGGYDRYYGNLYAGRYAAIPAAIRRGVMQPLLSLVPEAGWYKSKGHQLRWLHQLSFLEGADRYAGKPHVLLLQPRGAPEAADTGGQPGTRRDVGRSRHRGSLPRRPRGSARPHAVCGSRVRLPDHPVMITDRMSMAHGLEARSPFMDHRLAEFAARLPSRLKVQGRALRVIQRRLARALPAGRKSSTGPSRAFPRPCPTSCGPNTRPSTRRP